VEDEIMQFKTGMDQEEIDNFVEETLKEISLEEKIKQMHGRASVLLLFWDMMIMGHYNRKPYEGAGLKRLGIPALKFSDGPRGVSAGNSTCFPVAMARAASWNTQLHHAVGDVIGMECRANGANYYGGVCVNLLYHPGGGRAQESYGEDPYLAGEMSASLVQSVQKHNVMACVKHYALNNIEDTRFKVDVEVDERTLREIYLPQFKRCIKAGAASIMAAYNKVRREHCCENRYLLTTILKNEWDFKGFIISDFGFGIRNAVRAADAGLDMEMGGAKHFNNLRLGSAVRKELVPMGRIDDAVRRILRTILTYENRTDPQEYPKTVAASREHTLLAKKVSEESIVLLKNNEGTLPLNTTEIRKIAVIGRLAKAQNTGDHGSSSVYPPYVITPYDGILKETASLGIEILYDSGKIPGKAARIAEAADAVIIVAGMDHRDEGEGGVKILNTGGDRDSLKLHKPDIRLIKEVGKANTNTIVALVGGSAITVSDWEDSAAAILMTWYSGMEGGTALANILFGKVNPSGRLPFAVPRKETDLPPFDHKSGKVHYGYYNGYRYLDKEGIKPRFPFGYGLSYTRFTFGNLSCWRKDKTVEIEVGVENTGERSGGCVVQCYIGWIDSRVDRPVRSLKEFNKIYLDSGEKKKVHLTIPVSELSYYDSTHRRWVEEKTRNTVWVGPWNDEEVLLKAIV